MQASPAPARAARLGDRAVPLRRRQVLDDLSAVSEASAAPLPPSLAELVVPLCEPTVRPTETAADHVIVCPPSRAGAARLSGRAFVGRRDLRRSRGGSRLRSAASLPNGARRCPSLSSGKTTPAAQPWRHRHSSTTAVGWLHPPFGLTPVQRHKTPPPTYQAARVVKLSGERGESYLFLMSPDGIHHRESA